MGVYFLIKFNTRKAIRKEIECKRLEMIKIANQKGFTDKETIQVSKDLDKLLNLYQQK